MVCNNVSRQLTVVQYKLHDNMAAFMRDYWASCIFVSHYLKEGEATTNK